MASALCYGVFIVPVYLLHRRFSFGSDAPHRQALPRYAAVQGMAMLLATLFSVIAYGVLSMPTLLASILVVMMTSGVNFVVLRSWAFVHRTLRRLPMIAAPAKKLLNSVHDAAIFGRRVAVLSGHLARIIPSLGRCWTWVAGTGRSHWG